MVSDILDHHLFHVRKSGMLLQDTDLRCLWCCYLLYAFQGLFNDNLGPYITSLFGEHSLLATVPLGASIASAAVYMPMAKVLDKYGRAQALTIVTVSCLLGLILSAACNDIGTYCAGVIFTTLGFSMLTYTVDVITADTSMLKSRALAYSYTASPFIITAFAGPAAASNMFSDGSNWRWGFGALAIVFPCVVAPFYAVLFVNDRKIKQTTPLKQDQDKKQSVFGHVWGFFIEFDVLGIFIFVAGLVLFLLPFNLASSTDGSWASAQTIAMLVIGFVLLAIFPIVERYVPVPFARWDLLTTGNLLMVCLINALLSVAISTWGSYFLSYLQVVYGMSIEYAGYINSISNVTSGIWQIVIGILIRISGRYKWLLLTSAPIYALFTGLLIYFRQPTTSIGLIVMCEIFLSFAQSTLILCVEVAAVASVSHADVAVAIGLLCTAGYIGSAVGTTISAAIWTNTLPSVLSYALPDVYKDQINDIVGSIDEQLSFDFGTPVRDAIINAYAIAQTRMLIAGVVVTVVMLGLVVFMKDVKLKSVQQTRGRLF